jgi:hypothetical protein
MALPPRTSLGLTYRHTSDDLTHAEERLRLPVPLPLLIAFASFMLIDQYFGAALLSNDGPHYASVLKVGLSDGDLIAFPDHQHRGKLNAIASSALEFFDGDQVSLCDTVLFPARLDDSIHTTPASSCRRQCPIKIV